MKTRSAKFFSAVALAAALVVTVAVARTVHTRADVAQAPQSGAMRASPRAMAKSPLSGGIACGTLGYADCQKLEQMLPM